MKVKTITYSKVFPLGSYVNEKIGVEIELDDQDGFDESFEYAKDMVNRWGEKPLEFIAEPREFQGIIPKSNFTANQPIPTKDIAEEKSTDKYSEDEIINMIWESGSIEQVAQWKYYANRFPEIQKAYLNKLKQFV